VLANYWSAQLNNVVDEPIVLDPSASQVPARCRGGLDGGTAFTCKSDLTLYITQAFLTLIDKYFHDVDRALAIASVASHEIGHVLQYTLHQPEIERKHPSDATSQVVEQQADCLSGVWAGRAAGLAGGSPGVCNLVTFH
jgi:predicted metalloprotease